MSLETEINKLWREYVKLYPPEMQRWLRAEMPQLIVRRDDERLSRITGEGLDCGEHAAVLAGIREIVRRYWGLRS